MITFDNFEKDLDFIKEYFLKKNNNSFLKIDDKSSAIVTFRIYFCWVLSIIIFPLLCNILGLLGILIGIILMGVTSYKFQFLIHEACHRNLFTKQKINEFIGNLSASLFGMSLKSYRETHFLHHKHSNTINDPQFNDALGKKNSNLKKMDFVRFIFSPLYCSKFFLFIRRELKSNLKIIDIKNNKKNINLFFWFLIISLFLNLLIIFFIYFYTGQNILLAFSYHLSLATISLFLARIRTLAEHQYFHQASTPKKFVVSHKPNFFEKLFFYDLNFNYHLEHHIFPKIPHKNLKFFSEKYVKNLHVKYGTLSGSMLSTLFKRYQKAK